MKKDKNFPGDKDIEIILGTLLRVGVIASMGVVLIGGIVYLLINHSGIIDYSTFDAHRTKFSSIAAIFLGLGRLDSEAIIQFGVLLLIFTPILRVAFSIFGFLIERDYLYVLIGLLVLIVILFSLSNRLTG
jgi:uncharacterized membrane protein